MSVKQTAARSYGEAAIPFLAAFGESAAARQSAAAGLKLAAASQAIAVEAALADAMIVDNGPAQTLM